MLYLIPTWHDAIEETTGDGITSLLTMFLENNEPTELVLTELLPNLRYLLNENGLFGVHYHRIWDDILGIQVTNGLPVDVTKLRFPADISLSYTKHLVIANRQGQMYAKVHFNDKSLIDQVTYQSQNDLTVSEIYDDRGFMVSRRTVDSNEELIAQSWFNNRGLEIIRFDSRQSDDKQVSVIKNVGGFKNHNYRSVTDLVHEAVKNFFSKTVKVNEDAILADFSESNIAVLAGQSAKLPLSLLCVNLSKQEWCLPQVWQGLADQVRRILVVSDVEKKRVQTFLKTQAEKSKVKIGYPYYTGLQLGTSNEEDEMVMYVKTGRDVQPDLGTLVNIMASRVLNHDHNSLEIENTNALPTIAAAVMRAFSQHFPNLPEASLDAIQTILGGRDSATIVKGIQSLFPEVNPAKAEAVTVGGLTNKNDNVVNKEDREQYVKFLMKIKVHGFLPASELQKRLNTARILIDLQKPVDKFVQFMAISAGIPEILREVDELTISGTNGWVLSDEASLKEGLAFYMDNLRNWNQSLVYLVELIQKYMFDNQTKYWKGRLFKNARDETSDSLRQTD